MRRTIEENIKFIVFLIVYSVGVAYWAATMKTTVDQQTVIMAKTVELLDVHIAESKDKEIENARHDYTIMGMQDDIEEMQEDIDGLKERRDKIR